MNPEFEPPDKTKEEDELGGADDEDYDSPDEPRSCDREDHYERSCYHQPNHREHKIEPEESTD